MSAQSSSPKSVCVIPARGGSKRVPGKNIRPFCGRPLMAWSIDCAKESGLFDRIIVTTDSEDIAKVARECGAEVPFFRPPHLSDDITPTIPVVAHAVKELENQGEHYDYVCCLYATAPLVNPASLRKGFETIRSRPEKSFAISVTSYAFPIYRSIKLEEDDSIAMNFTDQEKYRTQDYPEAYHDAAQFYWGRPDSYYRENRFFTNASVGVRIPRSQVQDIDTEDDWILAEALFKVLRKAHLGHE